MDLILQILMVLGLLCLLPLAVTASYQIIKLSDDYKIIITMAIIGVWLSVLAVIGVKVG